MFIKPETATRGRWVAVSFIQTRAFAGDSQSVRETLRTSY